MLFIHINYTSINLTWKSSRAPMSRLVDAPRERDRGRGGREARHQRGAAGQPDWAENTRCPAVCQPRCPGRIWESPRLARAGVCVRSTRGKGGHQKKEKKKKASELFLFILYASPGFNSPSASSSSQRHTRVYRPRKPGGHEICHKNSRGDEIFSSSAALSLLLSPPRLPSLPLPAAV